MRETLLRKKHRFLLTLALAKDILEEIHNPLGIVSLPYEKVYGFTPSSYKKSHFVSTLSRALKVGDIDKIVREGEVYLRLTAKGNEKFSHEFPLVSFQKDPWDKKWRVLIYDIPEKRKGIREALRGKICSLGFGKLQESVYISPFPIEREMVEFLNSHSLSPHVLFLVSDTIFAGGDKYLAEGVWNLSKLNERYGQILKKIREKEGRSAEWIREVKAEYIDLLASDPFLPRELLPEDWLREAVKKEIRRLD